MMSLINSHKHVTFVTGPLISAQFHRLFGHFWRFARGRQAVGFFKSAGNKLVVTCFCQLDYQISVSGKRMMVPPTIARLPMWN